MTQTATQDRRQTGHSDSLTEGIRVLVGAQYHEEQSRPDTGRWFFSYRVVIRNEGDRSARLLTRHWRIKDADNAERAVDGPGVVGEHPELAPGESFEYVSAATLDTPWGTMEGWFRMEREDGEVFRVKIGRFFLAPTTAPLTELAANGV